MAKPYGKVAMSQSLSSDVLKKRVAELEAALDRTSQKLHVIIDNAFEFIGLLDPEGKILEANQSALRFIDVKREDIVGKFFWDTPWWSHSQEQQETIQKAIHSARQGEFVRFETTHRRRDGLLHHFDFSLTPLKDDQGRIIYLLPEGRDISDRKFMEQTLEQEKMFLNVVLENIEDGIVACDQNGILTLFNRATRDFHALPQQPLPPEDWSEHYDLFHVDGITRMKKDEIPLFRALQGEHVRNAEMVIAPQKGRKRTLRASGQSLFSPSGEKIGAVVSMHDTTEQKIAEEALHFINAQLEAKVKRRTENLAKANQELSREIEERKKTEKEREEVIKQLRNAIEEIKKLREILPICASCKRIRDDKGYWNQVEDYIRAHAGIEFSHSICPKCMKELYPDFTDNGEKKKG